MKRTDIIFILLLFAYLSAYANGSVTTYSSVRGVADPVFVSMPDVKLISEKLSVRLDYEYSRVRVKYILWNNSDKDFTDLDYGFPMDYRGREEQVLPVDIFERQYLENIQFRLNGKPLEFTASSPTLQDEETGLLRAWHFTKVSIPRYSFVTLEVEYSVMNGYVEEGSSPLFMYDFEGKGAFLSYDFSPAASWGDGIIRDLYVEVDATAVTLSGRYAYSPYSHISYNEGNDEEYNFIQKLIDEGVISKGLGLKKDGNFYTCHVRNFDLKKAEPLYISYSYNPSVDIVLSKKLNGDKYSVAVSNETKQYPSSNLSDMNLETAWVLPHGGIGEWIEFTLKDKKTLVSGLTIVNGYTKNETAYNENNRIRKIYLEIKEKQKEAYNAGFVINFEDKEYEPVCFENLIDKESWIDFFDYYAGGLLDNHYRNGATTDNYIEKIRISIREVYPGTKYNDTCISEILLFQ